MWHTRGPMTGRHVAHSDWLVRVPRGPVKGCHVAPRHWFDGLYTKLCLAFTEVEPVTSGQGKDPHIRASQHSDRRTCYENDIYIFEFVFSLRHGGKGPGRSPSPRHQHPYDRDQERGILFGGLLNG
jgi:hypothetical protein